MKKKKNDKLVIISIIIIIIFILIILLSVIISSLKKKEENRQIENVKQYTSINDFKTIKEIADYLDCTYIKEEKSKTENYSVDIYMKIKVLPYTDDKSNEGFYEKLISYSTSVLKFKNFRIIDKENNITIEVICDKEKQRIKNTIINGESNYFTKRDSELQIKNYQEVKITDFTVQSEIINKLINNNWRILDSEIGTKESTFNSYDIFFDEGVEVRRINNQVFNIVFTEKYKGNLVNNITTSTSKEDIIKILGEPTFTDDYTDVIGYRGKELYVFFSIINKQISIYANKEFSEEDNLYKLYKQYKEQNKTISELIKSVKDEWNDYDYYKETSDYAVLTYALRGVKIEYDTGTKNGIGIYNNYSGIIYDDIKWKDVTEKIQEIPNDIYINNKNLVFLQEIDRTNYVQSAKYYAQIERNRNKKENDILSKLFVESKSVLQDGSYSVKFISLDDRYANSEIKENISSGLWLNDSIYAYSVKQKGIYIYDAVQRKYGTLVSGNNENYEIKEFTNNILKYDEKTIKLNL